MSSHPYTAAACAAAAATGSAIGAAASKAFALAVAGAQDMAAHPKVSEFRAQPRVAAVVEALSPLVEALSPLVEALSPLVAAVAAAATPILERFGAYLGAALVLILLRKWMRRGRKSKLQ